jgi:hypothetical protein
MLTENVEGPAVLDHMLFHLPLQFDTKKAGEVVPFSGEVVFEIA